MGKRLSMKDIYIVYGWKCVHCAEGTGEFHDNGTNTGDKCSHCNKVYNRDEIVSTRQVNHWWVERPESE